MWVYVDGAKWISAGYGVWFGSDNPLNCCGNFPGKQTKMTAKIHAAIMAIRVAIDARIESLVIHTESEALYLKTILPIELLVSKNKWLELGEAINRFDGKISWKYVLRRRGNFGSM